MDKDAGRATRVGFVDKYADSGVLVIGAHFAEPTAGHIRTATARGDVRFQGLGLMASRSPTTDSTSSPPTAVINARAVDDALREFAPVVRLADGTHMLGRHEHVVAGPARLEGASPAPAARGTTRPARGPKSSSPTIRRATPRSARSSPTR